MTLFVLLTIFVLPYATAQTDNPSPGTGEGGTTSSSLTAHFNLPAQPLSSALRAYADQTGEQVVFFSEVGKDQKSADVIGNYTREEALNKLLRSTGLTFERINAKTIAITSTKTRATALGTTELRLAQVDEPKKEDAKNEEVSSDTSEEKSSGVPEILIKGSRILNMDIPRTRDDPQPYTIFTRETIERSGFLNLEEFLEQRLTMNVSGATNATDRAAGFQGNTSSIDLRGLGTNQTLILMDGRRMAGFASANAGAGLRQPDINGIPLAAVERIEVLPTTASSIYGGGATGGVINIVLRRDYVGSELGVTYNNTFDTDAATRRIDLSTGFNLADGKTNVLFSGSYSDANVLLRRDRDFVQRYRDRSFENAPETYLPPSAPPLGGTANIRSADNSNLVLKPVYGGTNLGSPFTHTPYGYAGLAASGTASLVANTGQYNFDFANGPRGAGMALASFPTVESGNLVIRRQFSNRVQGFIEANASNNVSHLTKSNVGDTRQLPATAPNNPFQQAITVAVNSESFNGGMDQHVTDSNRRMLAGVIVKLPWSWQIEADYSWNKSTHGTVAAQGLSPSTAAQLATQINSGSIDILRDPTLFPIDFGPYLRPTQGQTPGDFVLRDATVRLAGPLGSLPAGAPKLSVLIEERRARVGDQFFEQFESGVLLFPEQNQTVRSVYLEARVPVVSDSNTVRWIRQLDLQFSARSDAYRTNSASSVLALGPVRPASFPPIVRGVNKVSSIDPLVALWWKPIDDIALRASYGTGFLPPDVHQIVPRTGTTTSNTSLLDPRRGNTLVATPYATISDGNPNLKPEESKSWSAGMVVTPRKMKGLRVSIDYTRIERTDNIGGLPGGNQELLALENIYPERIVRGQKLSTDPVDWAGAITLIDSSLFNLSSVNLEAYDLQLDYSLPTSRFGTFEFFTLFTRSTYYRTQVAPGQPTYENVDYIGGPMKYKGNAGVTWSNGQLTLGWNTSYFPSQYTYSLQTLASSPSAVARQIRTQGNGGRVESQIYHNIFGVYKFDREGNGNGLAGRLLDGTSLTLGVRNLFNAEPPMRLGSYSGFGDPQLSIYYCTLTKQFGS